MVTNHNNNQGDKNCTPIFSAAQSGTQIFLVLAFDHMCLCLCSSFN